MCREAKNMSPGKKYVPWQKGKKSSEEILLRQYFSTRGGKYFSTRVGSIFQLAVGRTESGFLLHYQLAQTNNFSCLR